MKRSTRLEKIAELNLGFENSAGAALASARSQHQKQLDQLEQLQQYKEEYQQRLSARKDGDITATEIRDYQYFFASLDNAITQQARLISQTEQQVEESRQNWLSKKQDVSKMTRAAENLKAQESAAQSKQEQKEIDEFNLHMFSAGNGLSNPH